MLRQHQTSLDDRKKFTAFCINKTLAFQYVKQLMEEKCWEKSVTFPFRSREANLRFRENSHLLVNLVCNLSPWDLTKS